MNTYQCLSQPGEYLLVLQLTDIVALLRTNLHSGCSTKAHHDTSCWHTISSWNETQPFSWLELTVLVLEEVENREDLSEVGHQRLSHLVSRHHQMLKNFNHVAHHPMVPCVQSIWRVGEMAKVRYQSSDKSRKKSCKDKESFSFWTRLLDIN